MAALSMEEGLRQAGYVDSRMLASGDRWQLWEASRADVLERHSLRLLFLDSRSSWGIAPDIIKAVHRVPGGASGYHIVVRCSSALAEDLPRARKEFHGLSAHSLRQLVGKQTLGIRTVEHAGGDSTQFFVEPRLSGEHAALDEQAADFLRRWLSSDDPGVPRIGILTAHAGVGKTTVAIQTFLRLLRSAGDERLPLFITSDQWGRLQNISELRLWDIWKEAMEALYDTTTSSAAFDTYLRTGVVVPIFDGFDELCTRFPGSFSPAVILDQLKVLLNETDGRILLTARHAFWSEQVSPEDRVGIAEFSLEPFDDPRVDSYLAKRFPSRPDRQDVGRSVLKRLQGLTESRRHAEDVTRVPLIVYMAAESVVVEAEDGPESLRPFADVFREYLEAEDPREAVLLLFLNRECIRQKLTLNPREQMRLFEDLAFELGTSFTPADLGLYGDAIRPLTSQEHQSLASHALLKAREGRLQFRFDFIADYLAARRLVKDLQGRRMEPGTRSFLQRHTRGDSGVIALAGKRLLEVVKDEWRKVLRDSWAGMADPLAQCTLMHLYLRALESWDPSLTSAERAEQLARLVSPTRTKEFAKLRLEGILPSLDLRGQLFINCDLSAVTFSNCLFNGDTVFDGCSLQEGLEINNCEGFGLVRFHGTCRMDAITRSRLQELQGGAHRLAVTRDQLLETLRLVLGRFKGPVGLRSIDADQLVSGVLRRAPLTGAVISVLKEMVVIRSEDGVDGKLGITQSAETDVLNLIANGTLTGRVRAALRHLETLHGITHAGA